MGLERISYVLAACLLLGVLLASLTVIAVVVLVPDSPDEDNEMMKQQDAPTTASNCSVTSEAPHTGLELQPRGFQGRQDHAADEESGTFANVRQHRTTLSRDTCEFLRWQRQDESEHRHRQRDGGR